MNPVIQHKYTCDPTAIVAGDRVYLYTGHDEAPSGVDRYVMNEWLVFSSSDLINWTEHPLPLRATDFTWAGGDAFASKVIVKDGLYYWFVSVSHIPGNSKESSMTFLITVLRIVRVLSTSKAILISFITTERCPAEAVTGDRSASMRCITTLAVQ